MLPWPGSAAHENGNPTGNRLRIALVTETYPPEINGVAMTVARVVEGLVAQGHEVQLIRPRQSKTDRAMTKTGLSEVLARGLPIPRYPGIKLGLPAGRMLGRGWRDRKPDVLHIATEGPLGWSALQAARRLGVPAVSEFRTNFHAYSQHYGVGCLRNLILSYLRTFHNRTACTMVPTAALGRELQAAGFERLEVVARGVDTALFDPGRRCETLRRNWGAGPDTLVAIGVGRLAPEKNLALMRAAFERMRAARPDVKLVLVGDGPARAAMQAQCPDAIFAGKRLGEDLARHYASADLLLFPSLTETFGNVTLEGMASGLVVAAFDYGAAGEVVRHGKNGLLAAYAEEPAYLRIVTEAARLWARIRRIGLQARADASQLGWERIVSQIEMHYRNAIASHPHGSVAKLAAPGWQLPDRGEVSPELITAKIR